VIGGGRGGEKERGREKGREKFVLITLIKGTKISGWKTRQNVSEF